MENGNWGLGIGDWGLVFWLIPKLGSLNPQILNFLNFYYY